MQAGHIFTFPKEFHILLSCFFFSAFPQLRNNSISANNNNKKGTITTQFRFLYGASPCRGVGNSDKRKNTVWVRFELNFCFFFVFPGVVFFCSVFSRTAGDHPWKVYYIETKERKRALYIFRGWLDYPLCFKFLTGWDAEIRRKKKEKMINDEQKKRFLFFSFQTGTAPNAMNRFLWNCRSLSLPQDRQKAQLSLFNNFSSAQRKMNWKQINRNYFLFSSIQMLQGVNRKFFALPLKYFFWVYFRFISFAESPRRETIKIPRKKKQSIQVVNCG